MNSIPHVGYGNNLTVVNFISAGYLSHVDDRLASAEIGINSSSSSSSQLHQCSSSNTSPSVLMRLARNQDFFRQELISSGLIGFTGQGPISMAHVHSTIAVWHTMGPEWALLPLDQRDWSRGPLIVDSVLSSDVPSEPPPSITLTEAQYEGHDDFELLDPLEPIDPLFCCDMDNP